MVASGSGPSFHTSEPTQAQEKFEPVKRYTFASDDGSNPVMETVTISCNPYPKFKLVYNAQNGSVTVPELNSVPYSHLLYLCADLTHTLNERNKS